MGNATPKLNGAKYIITMAELEGLTRQSSKKITLNFSADDQKQLIPLPGYKTGVPSTLVHKYLTNQGLSYTFKVVAFMNLKGGIGKTTSCISTATRAMQYGFKTCILDMDSQGSASVAFDRVPKDDDPIFCDVWQKPDEILMKSIQKIEEHLYILPSSLENGLLDSMLMNPASQKNAVRGVCTTLQQNGFNLAIIDCPPALGTAVISTICAADTIVIPTCGDDFSFKGLELTLNEISSICETFNMPQPEIRILYTKFDRRIKLSLDAAKRLETEYKSYLIPQPIRTSTEFANALQKRETVFATSKKSAAKTDYDFCTRNLLGLDNFME
jgi:chromosome partitioning protein